MSEQLQLLLPLLEKTLGHRPSPPTIFRWHTVGVKLSDGGRVKLDAKKVGGRLYASPQAVERFINAQNQPAIESNDAANERSPETEARLEEAGLL
jgi:hypothetical protein